MKDTTDVTVECVAARIRVLMDRFGWSQIDVSNIVGRKPTTVGEWRTAQNFPRAENVVVLCDKAGVTLDWLYRGRIGAMDQKYAAELDRAVAVMLRST